MNAHANTAIDVNSSDVRDRTTELCMKAYAVMELIRCASVSRDCTDYEAISNAAWAARDMIKEAGQLNGWF
jgi:hypothetical protein